MGLPPFFKGEVLPIWGFPPLKKGGQGGFLMSPWTMQFSNRTTLTFCETIKGKG